MDKHEKQLLLCSITYWGLIALSILVALLQIPIPIEIPMIPFELVSAIIVALVSAIIIAVGNFLGLWRGFLGIERKIDKKLNLYEKRFDAKIDAYWEKFRLSEEGKALMESLDGLRKIVKTSEASDLLKEATAAFKELRTIMKKMAERMEASQETEEEEESPVLPSLES